MTRLSPRRTAFPDHSQVYLTSIGWRAESGRGRKSPLYPTRRDALGWLERQRNREKQEIPANA